ncbi:hypothetical protein E2C01_023311 [Portunus trituberculatus]|uniref:Uncharacterized protein n=1 Tax=Portunus trituberculatus TaxID=210409 RepID=A0A5B7E9M9_PORTR|nr:hypothetical protein [Portunus trituberculatus]
MLHPECDSLFARMLDINAVITSVIHFVLSSAGVQLNGATQPVTYLYSSVAALHFPLLPLLAAPCAASEEP